MRQLPRRPKRVEIYKKSGQIQAYSKRKLERSLEHTCLDPQSRKAIVEEVTQKIPPITTSNEIFQRTATLVNRRSRLAASQYSLKRALFDLGPDGHNFESYVARYFQTLGFETKECVIVQGLHVKHEIDVIAIKKKKKYFIECKFHNRQGIKNDIKTALYVKARWDDLKQGPHGKGISAFYLATNTSFTQDALTYARGTGLKLLGINAPESVSFLDEIKALRLYPLTSLKKLNRAQKKILLKKNLILATDLLNHTHLLTDMGMDESQLSGLMEEIYILTGERL